MTGRRRTLEALAAVLVLSCSKEDYREFKERLSKTSRVWDVDCPAGQMRCRGGVVSGAQVKRRPRRCPEEDESCGCPWTWVGDCRLATCVAEDVRVVVPDNIALRQLCAPAPDAPPFAVPAPGAPIPPGGAEACEGGASFACVAGKVIQCGTTLKVTASCLQGCSVADAVGRALTEPVSAEAAVDILCTR